MFSSLTFWETQVIPLPFCLAEAFLEHKRAEFFCGTSMRSLPSNAPEPVPKPPQLRSYLRSCLLSCTFVCAREFIRKKAKRYLGSSCLFLFKSYFFILHFNLFVSGAFTGKFDCDFATASKNFTLLLKSKDVESSGSFSPPRLLPAGFVGRKDTGEGCAGWRCSSAKATVLLSRTTSSVPCQILGQVLLSATCPWGKFVSHGYLVSCDGVLNAGDRDVVPTQKQQALHEGLACPRL